MAQFVNSGYEGIADGTALTTGSPGNGDSSITTVSPGSGGVIEYTTDQSAHGGGSVGLTQATAATTCYYQYNDGADFTTGAIRFMLYLTGSPSATCDFPCRFVNASNSTTFSFQMTSGRLLRISAGSSAQMTTAVSLNTWYRVEGQMSSINSSGTITLKLYTGDSLTLVDSIQLTGLALANAMRGVRLGKLSSATLATWYYDDVAVVSGSATEIGPATAAVNINAATILGSTNVLSNFSVVIDTDPQPSTVATPAAAVPAPTITAVVNAVINPSVIAPPATDVPAPTPFVNMTVDQPAVVTGQTQMDPTTILSETNATPAVIDPPATDVPAPSLTITDTVAAVLVAPPTTSVPAPTVQADQTVLAVLIAPPATSMPAPFVDTGTQASINAVLIAPPVTSVFDPLSITAITNALIGPTAIDTPAPSVFSPTITTDQIVTALIILGVTAMDPVAVSGGAEVSAIIIAPPAPTMDPAVVAGGAVVTAVMIAPPPADLSGLSVLAETNTFPLLIAPPAPTMDAPSVQTAGNATVLAVIIAPPATAMDPVVASGGTDAFLTAVLIDPPVTTMDPVSILAGQGAFPPVSVIDSVTTIFDPVVQGGTDVNVLATLVAPPATTVPAPQIDVTSSAFITAVSVDGVTSFFAPTVSAQQTALITPSVIDGQTSFPDPLVTNDVNLTAATIAPPPTDVPPPSIFTGGGVNIAAVIIAPPATSVPAPALSTSSFVAAEVINGRTTIYLPVLREANRFPKFMSLAPTKRYNITV